MFITQFLFFIIAFTGSVQAEDFLLRSLDSSIATKVTSLGSSQKVLVTFSNGSIESHRIDIGYGDRFMSDDVSFQNLAVVFPERIDIAANSSVEVEVKVACMNANRGIAPSDYSGWQKSFDGDLRDALLATEPGASLLG